MIFDADTHMMERPDWIAQFADPKIRPRLAPFLEGQREALARFEDALRRFEERSEDPAVARDADEAFMTMRYKGWHGLGAFDAGERRHANDLLGFQAQIVFPTTAFNQVIAAGDEEVLLGGIRALNRGMAAYCSVDPRMLGSGYIPLGLGPDVAVAFLDEAVAAGFKVLLIDRVQ